MGNTEQDVNHVIILDWIKELETEVVKTSPWLCTTRLKVVLGRLACKVHNKDRCAGSKLMLLPVFNQTTTLFFYRGESIDPHLHLQ